MWPHSQGVPGFRRFRFAEVSELGGTGRVCQSGGSGAAGRRRSQATPRGAGSFDGGPASRTAMAGSLARARALTIVRATRRARASSSGLAPPVSTPSE